MPRESKMKFLKEWKPYEDFHGAMMTAIVRHFSKRHVNTMHNGRVLINSSRMAEEIMGLPYTSSGEFAALWANVNTHVWLDEDKVYHYLGFAYDEKGRSQYAILKDDQENEIVIDISI